MDKYKIRLTLDFTPEQLETIETFFNYNNWDFEKAKISNSNDLSSGKCDVSTQTQNCVSLVTNESCEDGPPPEFHIEQDLLEDERAYCFCRPCITSEANKQFWWESDDVPPSVNNHGIRKEKYKRFWTMMFHQRVWDDPRYKRKKQLALQSDPRFRRYVWHRRDIMPNCVLTIVRQWLPNPQGAPYMGHMWD